MVTLHGPWGWTLFGLIWGIAVIGILLKIFRFGNVGWLSLGLEG